MATIKDTLAYLLLNYPFKAELSNARVTKMIYLADWRHVLKTDNQVTEIRWYYDNYGPFVWDVKNTATRETGLFKVEETSNYYGGPKSEFEIKDINYKPNLGQTEKDALDHVIRHTQQLGWDDFIKLVYGTFPVVSSERYSFLDLQTKARAYKRTQAKFF